MNRLRHNFMPSGMLVLALLLLTFALVSCGEDDPVAPAINHAPATPVIDTGAGSPDDGAVGIALGAQLHWSCSDPDDDPVTYMVHFGTASSPPAVGSMQATPSYTPAGLVNDTTYYWQIIATDDGGKTTSSAIWSFTTVAATSETVSAPGAPTGPAAGETAASLGYTATGSTSSEGHTVEYRFDWNDGTMSDWSATMPANHAWAAAGTYAVKAQARCGADTAVESAWSTVLSVTVTAPAGETVSWPSTPSGPTSGAIAESLTYTVSGGSSSEGHALEYRFDWGDGTYSTWDPGATDSHAWSASGIYTARAQARCQDHPAVVSTWSSVLQVSIDVAETVTRPQTPEGDTPVEVSIPHSYTIRHAVSTMGHTLEYRMDWGDGAMSDWAVALRFDNAWDTPGSYEVKAQARCQQHPDVMSDWSYVPLAVTVQASETVSTPDALTGPDTGEIQVQLSYEYSGAVSSWGHDVEYRVDWDGTIGGWSINAFGSHSWTTAGSYDVLVQARCQDHPAIETDWSAPLTVTISDPPEAVYPPSFNRPSPTGGVGEDQEIETRGVSTNLYHPVEVRINWDDGTFSDWGPKVSVSYTRIHAWSAAGTYQLRAQSRCAEHPEFVSDWSDPFTLEILATESISTPNLMYIQPEQTYDIGAYIVFYITLAESDFGHAVEYEVDWGDGTVSPWSDNNSVRVPTDVPAEFQIRARARCIQHPEAVSDWSWTAVVHVLDLETIPGISSVVGPATGTVGVPVSFSYPGAVSSFGHELEYQLYISYSESVPGVAQGWATAANLTYTWDAPATNYVQIQARCALHPEVESVKSYNHFIRITE